MTMLVLDVETTQKAPKPHFSATPHYRDNRIVQFGHSRPTTAPGLPVTFPAGLAGSYSDISLFVGQHIKFDILHMCYATHMPPRVFLRNATVWDTQIADYILSGQRDKPRKLEDLCHAYGIPFVKDPTVTAAFEANEGAESIDPEVLEKYLCADIASTEKVALRQMSEMRPEQLTLMTHMMEMCVATIEMEYNGLPWSYDEAALARAHQQAAAATLAISFTRAVKEWLKMNKLPDDALPPEVSPTVLGKVLFSQEIAWEERTLVPTKKGGRRTKVVNNAAKCVPLLDPDWAALHADRTPGGDFALNEQAFEKIQTDGEVNAAFLDLGVPGSMSLSQLQAAVRSLIGMYTEYKASEKIVSTYIDGVSQFVIDGKVHCSYNLAETRTGRLSCSKPNLQNPPPIAKGCYVAPDGWKFLEIDYKQIEVVGLAILSGDPTLLLDIQLGRDIHTELYKEMYGRPPSAAERGAFKPLTFGLIYGAGDKTLALNAKVSLDVVRSFRKTFFSRYPMVGQWYKSLEQRAVRGRVPTTRVADNGLPLAEWVYQGPTGRKLVFTEGLVPWNKSKTNFSPADLANWPVQSFATADIVPTMIAVLMRRLWESEFVDDALLVCTTHDSVGMLVREEELDKAWELCYNVLSRTSEIFGKLYGLTIDCPLDVSATVGKTWKECGDKYNHPLAAPKRA